MATSARALAQPPSLNYLHLFGMRRDPLAAFTSIARRHGHVVRFPGLRGFFSAYQLTHPRDIEHVLQTNAQNYTKGRNYKKFIPSTGNGLLVSDGDLWRRQRRLAQPAFHRQRLAAFAETMAREAETQAAHWRGRPDRAAALDVAAEMMRLTLRIIGLTMFSTDLSAETDVIGRSLDIIRAHSIRRMWQPVSLPVSVPTPANLRFRRALADGDRVMYEVIAARRSGEIQNDDLLSLLLRARDEETGEGMSDEQLRAEIVTFIGAGHESTSVTLSWMWYLLAQHPEVEERLHEELARELAGRTPTLEDLPRLTYTTMVLEETMRLYPPAWALSRTARGADTYGGYPVAAGSEALILAYVTHRHPDFWDDPEKFDPERFAPAAKEARPRFSYFPFGGGPRLCIGQHFAMTEMLVVVATLAQRFRLRLAPGRAVTPEASITLRPREGVHMTLHER
jgi:cytochrome P450